MLDVNLKELTDKQLEERIQKLNNIVYSSNRNLSMQAYPYLLQLYEEQNSRSSAKLEKHLNDSGSKLDEIIKIG